MAQNLLERLENTDDILLHYYPLHSELFHWGFDLKSNLSEWIVQHPNEYKEAIQQSLSVGCDLVSTSTQSINPWRAQTHGLRDKVYEYNYTSAKLAREVTPSDRYLAGFCSMTNPDFLQPLGNLTENEVTAGYQEQISGLLDGGVDLIMVVGNHIDAGTIAIQVAKELADVIVIAHNVFYNGPKGFRNMYGLDPAAATKTVLDAGADIVGASCGLMKPEELEDDPKTYYEFTTDLIKELRASFDGFLSIQPNAGFARLIDNVTTYTAKPNEFAREYPKMVQAGARIIGGCCGTSLEHYRQIYEVHKNLKI